MRYLCALIEQLRDTQMLPKMAIVDPGANGGLDFSQRTAPVFALDLFYSLVSTQIGTDEPPHTWRHRNIRDPRL